MWSWARRLNKDARQVVPDLQRVRLQDRQVIVAFDSDVMTKPSVHAALEALARFLGSRGAMVKFCYLPEHEPGVKCGLDDFLATGATEQMWEYVVDDLRVPVKVEAKPKRAVLHTAHLLRYVDNLIRRYVHFPAHIGPPAHRAVPVRAAHVDGRDGDAVSVSPTLLIDEIDAVFTNRSERAEALRRVLNAGNRRGSVVVRGTSDCEPVMFDTFCPKVLARNN